MNKFHHVTNALQTQEVVTFTEMAIDSIFPAPRRPDPMSQLALILSGCRPEKSQKELIEYLCEAYKIVHWETFDGRMMCMVHHFKKQE